jgi:hypothetical protein
MLYENPGGCLEIYPRGKKVFIIGIDRKEYPPHFRSIQYVTVKALKNQGLLECIQREFSQTYQRVAFEQYQLTEKGKQAATTITPEDMVTVPGKKPELTEAQITSVLQKEFSERTGWAFFSQLRGSTGYFYNQQYLDGWAINLWPSRGTQIIAFEIKVYRSDLLKELKDSDKRVYAMNVSNQFYFVTPEGLMKKDEIPDDCGLMEVQNQNGYLTIRKIKKAPVRRLEMPSWWFVASIARLVYRGEQNL